MALATSAWARYAGTERGRLAKLLAEGAASGCRRYTRPTMAPPRRALTVAHTALVLLLVTSLALVGGAGARVSAPGLAGQLLVAAPEMPDPRFARVVIYVVRHDATGAMGVAVNRPIGDVALAGLMRQLGLPHQGVHGTVRLHAGGPVEGSRLFVLHTADYAAEGTVSIDSSISLTTHPDVLGGIAAGSRPRRAFVALGYAGWGPGQLEDEIRRGGWVTAAADEGLVFGDDHEKKWQRAMTRRRIEL
jgi:putative transcriptional regulator